MKNRMVDLRNHLFATLEALQDKEEPMDIERALAVASVAHEVVAAAKVEVDYARVTQQQPCSDFFQGGTSTPQLPGRSS